jgi:uncharacterized membrane protein YgdD (TMEM256/DUF423 family)
MAETLFDAIAAFGDKVSRVSLFLVLISALLGASGVALAAGAAHIKDSAALMSASQLLMVHAGAGLGLAALANRDLGRALWLTVASFALQAGVILFSLDIVWRVFLENRLFPYAAPIGGSTIILAWLALAAWALGEIVLPSHAARGGGAKNNQSS